MGGWPRSDNKANSVQLLLQLPTGPSKSLLSRVGGVGGWLDEMKIRLTQFNCYCNCLLELSLAMTNFCGNSIAYSCPITGHLFM